MPKKINSLSKIHFQGWKTIFKQVYHRLGEDQIAIVSGGVAFFVFLALFPAIIAILSIYGLVVDPQLAEQHLSELSRLMPAEVFLVLKNRMTNLLTTEQNTLEWGTIIGLLVSIWSANSGTKSLFNGLDIAYKSDNSKGIIFYNIYSLAFTVAAFIALISSMFLIVLFPAIVESLGLPHQLELWLIWLRWPFMACLIMLSVSLIYRYVPDRHIPEFRWVMPGTFLTALLWLLISWGFSAFAGYFGRYGEIYGSISAVVILMLWLYLTSFIILLGGELNSTIESYAGRDG